MSDNEHASREDKTRNMGTLSIETLLEKRMMMEFLDRGDYESWLSRCTHTRQAVENKEKKHIEIICPASLFVYLFLCRVQFIVLVL